MALAGAAVSRAARRREELGRYSLLNPRMIVALAHGGFGLVCLLRPNLDDLFRAYRPFGDVTPWGVGLLALAFVLTLAPRASWMLMIAQLASALAFLVIGGLLTMGVGLLPTGMMLFGFALTSLLLFRRSFGEWLEGQGWYHEWQMEPPAWLARRAWFQRLRARYGRDSDG